VLLSRPSYLIRHTDISGGGRYVEVGVNHFGFYLWDVEILNIISCLLSISKERNTQ
jgi:hypothetical protein